MNNWIYPYVLDLIDGILYCDMTAEELDNFLSVTYSEDGFFHPYLITYDYPADFESQIYYIYPRSKK